MKKILFELKRKHKTAYLGLWILFFLYITAIFADFISPYHFDNEKREFSYAPPTKIHFIENSKPVWPFIYGYDFELNKYHQRIYKENKDSIYKINFFCKSDDYKFLGLFKTNVHLFGVDAPGRLYLVGADSRGRDLFSRILYGARFSLSIGLIGAVIAFAIGMIVGGVSGYYSGKTDNILMRLCEMIMMVPSFYLLLALRASFPADISSVQVYFFLVVILSFIGWAGMARVIRGMSLSLSKREYILVAKSQSMSNFKIIVKHVLPHTFSYSIVAVTLSVPGYILGESGLSFLGLGIQDPYASWGNLLSEAMSIAHIKLHPWILIPGFMIFITVMAFNLLGEGLRDIADPHKKIR